jgi:hypothetical protein
MNNLRAARGRFVAHARHEMRHFASPGPLRRRGPFALATGMEPLFWMCTLISRFLWAFAAAVQLLRSARGV